MNRSVAQALAPSRPPIPKSVTVPLIKDIIPQENVTPEMTVRGGEDSYTGLPMDSKTKSSTTPPIPMYSKTEGSTAPPIPVRVPPTTNGILTTSSNSLEGTSRNPFVSTDTIHQETSLLGGQASPSIPPVPPVPARAAPPVPIPVLANGLTDVTNSNPNTNGTVSSRAAPPVPSRSLDCTPGVATSVPAIPTAVPRAQQSLTPADAATTQSTQSTQSTKPTPPAVPSRALVNSGNSNSTHAKPIPPPIPQRRDI